MFEFNKNKIRTVLKVTLWAYVVPCLVLIYVSMNLNFDTEQTSIFFVIYLLLVTLFNISIAKKICSEEQDLEQYDVTGLQSLGPGIQMQKSVLSKIITTNFNDENTTSTIIVDPPPPYNVVNEEPPPYSQIKYYWRMFRKSPNRRSARSITDIRRSKPDVENPSPTADKIGSKEKVKRYPSSPN